jgi:AbrB family looped-hinge helix DNA binding protein
MRISERGQITIPKALRNRFGLPPGAEVDLIPTEQGLIIRKRTAAEHPVDRMSGILGADALGKGVSVDEYIEEIRGR